MSYDIEDFLEGAVGLVNGYQLLCDQVRTGRPCANHRLWEIISRLIPECENRADYPDTSCFVKGVLDPSTGLVGNTVHEGVYNLALNTLEKLLLRARRHYPQMNWPSRQQLHVTRRQELPQEGLAVLEKLLIGPTGRLVGPGAIPGAADTVLQGLRLRVLQKDAIVDLLEDEADEGVARFQEQDPEEQARFINRLFRYAPGSGFDPKDVLRSARGLSRKAKTFLKRLCAEATTGQAVSTKQLRRGEQKTQSTNVAFSRMLLSLEERRLIVRMNRRTGIQSQQSIRTRPDQRLAQRTTHVSLTLLGAAVVGHLDRKG
jgi:hypothetical protein